MSSVVPAIVAYNAAISEPDTPSASPEDVGAKAHHEKNAKGFVNPWPSYNQAMNLIDTFKAITSYRFSGHTMPDGNLKEDVTKITVVKPVFPESRSTSDSKLIATWLGHACCYVAFPQGLRVLFDPVLSSRCGPYGVLGPKRFTPPPCQIEDIPVVDAVIISHNHYDHLDYYSLKKIVAKSPNVQFFVPLGIKEWFESSGFTNVYELDWWEEKQLTLAPESPEKAEVEEGAHTEPSSEGKITATIACLPAQHNSNRGVTDRNHTLWASWSVSSGGKKVWFGGDTGYRSVPPGETNEDEYDTAKYDHLPVCPAFKQIGELRGPFDLGMIPIGAYAGRHIFSHMHASPSDSVNIFRDTRCKAAFGIHWGTWALTFEPVLEPKNKLEERMELLKKEDPNIGWFGTLNIGESREF